jgi:hypothetical protein
VERQTDVALEDSRGRREAAIESAKRCESELAAWKASGVRYVVLGPNERAQACCAQMELPLIRRMVAGDHRVRILDLEAPDAREVFMQWALFVAPRKGQVN